MLAKVLRAAARRLGMRRYLAATPGKNNRLYQPVFSPWLDPAGFGRTYEDIQPFTLVDPQRCWVLYSLARQARHLAGEFWECGVYRGGTARLLARVARQDERALRLFDTFAGMPTPDATRDWHQAGDFSDTSKEEVRRVVDYAHAMLHPGRLPGTFQGLEDRVVSLAHVDVDLYQSVLDSCCFIYPRLAAGGIMVFDDYGWRTCPGAKLAVDEFFEDKPEVPLILPTGQAVVVRLPANP